MKKRMLMIATLVLTIYHVALADYWTINDFRISAGETKDVNIYLGNNEDYVAFQFDLYLPEGITVESYSPIRERIPESITLSMARQNDGCYRFVATTMDAGPLMSIVGYSGDIIKLTVKAAEDMAPGTYEGYLRHLKLSRADAIGWQADEMSPFPVVVIEPSVVTANNEWRPYGEENPTFSYYVEGGYLEGEPTIQCDATIASPAGTYDIVVEPGTVTNYNVTYVPGTLTIMKVPLTVSVGTYVKKQGEPIPEFMLNYDGFRLNDTEEMLTVKPTTMTTATESSEPGEYPIIIKDGESQNYDFNYYYGKLIVVAADAVVVSAKDYTREYGEENPTFEYTVEGAALEGEPLITCDATPTSPVGTYDIWVSQGSVTNFNVTYVPGTLTITKAPLTVSAGTYTKKQGEPVPEFVLSYDGFKNGETEDALIAKPTTITTVTESSAPGEYPIIVKDGESPNYDFSYVYGKVIVVEADATVITAKNYTRQYGDANPVFEYTVEGAALVGEPAITCAATPTSPVGTYDILVSQGTVGNYNVTYVAGTLTIEKAPLTVSAGFYTKKQGDPMPELTPAYEGFKNAETDDVLLVKPTIMTPATVASAPGSYPVIVSGGKAQNYELSYVNGLLIVDEADPVIITVKNYSREYGEENPTFEYTVDGAALQGQPVITCAATSMSPIGTYDILVSQGTVTNYNVIYVAGTLTITKAPLTVSAGTYTKKQSDLMPVFTPAYEGFKNDDFEDVLISKPVVTTTATEESGPGEYPVMVSGGEAENYALEYVSGKLIIVEDDAIVIMAENYTRQYGEDNPTFDYFVDGEGLKGSPEITCEATPTSSVGTYDIVVSKGTVTNSNVTYIAGTLTITKAPLTVSAGTYTKKQGEDLPEFTLTYEGFMNDETADVLATKPTAATIATAASAPGEYPVIVSGGEAQNYSLNYVNGKLIIVEADATIIKAKSYTRQYGDANPVFEYTVEGAALVGEPVITCTATATSPVGTYDIIVKQGTVTNYNVTYVAGKLTIYKAPLTIAAGTYTKKQGDPLPAFTLSYSGFKNNETADVMITKPTATTTATEDSAPGEYPVTVSGGEAHNYALSYVDGKLIVNEADPVTIIVTNCSREYGEANPVFEYTVEGAELEGTPEITCEATATSPVGTYDIVIKQGTVTNYNVTYVAGTMTITKAPLTIAAGTYTKKQGEAMPDFTLTYTGFKNNETKDVLTKQPTVSCQATESSAPGEYHVVVSGAEAKNYDISYTDGVLIVTEGTGIMTISVENPVDVYDIRGNKVRDKATTLDGLAKGIYIVRGRKVVVK